MEKIQSKGEEKGLFLEAIAPEIKVLGFLDRKNEATI